MNKKTKVWLIVALSFVIFGCVMFGGVMTMLNWDFMKLSTSKYVTNQYDVTEEFSNISIVSDTSDIVFIPVDKKDISVECVEQNNMQYSVFIENNTLYIKISDTTKWYEHIGFNFGKSKIAVYIPYGEYGKLSIDSNTGFVEIPYDYMFESIDISLNTGDISCFASASNDIKLNTSTGDITVGDLSAKNMEFSVTTGRVIASNISCDNDMKLTVTTGKSKFNNIECKNFTSIGSTGNLSVSNLIASDIISVERSTGDILFECCDAKELYVKTDTGDVKGSLLSDKTFVTQSNTGNVNIPDISIGGKCELKTNTGNIDIVIDK